MVVIGGHAPFTLFTVLRSNKLLDVADMTVPSLHERFLLAENDSSDI